MKWIGILFAVTAVVGWDRPTAQAAVKEQFSRSAYIAHIDYLAADSLQGRKPGTPGIERAAQYIADQFRSIGLEPAGDDQTFFQAFEVKLAAEKTDNGYLRIEGADIDAKQGDDYVPFYFSSDDKFSGDVVFAGYGIVNEDKKHDDFVHLDVEGKVVLMLRREPPSWANDNQGDYTPHAQFSNKIYNAKDRGAVAVLIANQNPGDDGEDRLTRWIGMGGGGDYGLPALHVTRKLADKLLAAGGLNSLDALQNKLDAGGYASKALTGVKISGDPGIRRKTATTRNVVGMLRGSGKYANEVVVIGAHYDHLGRTVPRRGFGQSKRSEEPQLQIHNGADDNASGTAGVIELAKALRRRSGLKRSVLFIAFSAEETGLLGSKHYVKHPSIDLDRIVAMLNLDMIGRLPVDDDDAKVQVFGTKAAEEFEEMIERLGKRRGLTIQASASAIGPSDHTSFYREKIPALHFFTGLHGDYHRPGDDTDKINTDGAVSVLNLVYDVAEEIVNGDAKPTYHEFTERARVSGRGGFRVRMGIYPSYADNDDGLVVDGVVDGGPAADAGMKSGDIIVKIAETDVANIRDYMGALRSNKPGDTVDVIVKRGGDKVTLNVKLMGS